MGYPDSDSDAAGEEDAEAFLEKLRANMNSNNVRKKRPKQTTSKKSKSTLQRGNSTDEDMNCNGRRVENYSNSKSKRNTSKRKNSEDKEGNMDVNKINIVDRRETLKRNRSKTNNSNDTAKDLGSIEGEDHRPLVCASGKKTPSLPGSPLSQNDQEDEEPFEDQIENLMNENPSTAIDDMSDNESHSSDQEDNHLPSQSIARVISPKVPSPPYTVALSPNIIPSPPHTAFSPANFIASPPHTGLDYNSPPLPTSITNVDDGDADEQSSPINHPISMPTTPLSYMITSLLKSKLTSHGKEMDEDDKMKEDVSDNVDSASESEKSGFASTTSSKIKEPIPNEKPSCSGINNSEPPSQSIFSVNTKKSLFQRLKAAKYGLDKQEVAVSSDEESDSSSTPVSSQHKEPTDSSTSNQVNEFYDDGGYNCDIDEFADYLQGDVSFMANAADQLESQEQKDGPTGKACTPVNNKKQSYGKDGTGTNDGTPITPIPDFQNMKTPDLRVSEKGLQNYYTMMIMMMILTLMIIMMVVVVSLL